MRDDLVERLRPCPFCGGEVMPRHALWVSGGDVDSIIHAAPSPGCGLGDFSVNSADDGETVAAAWNQRAGRLAELERTTPEEVVEMARHTFQTFLCGRPADQRGACRDCNNNTGCLTVASAVLSAIAAPLRAQGAAVELERCAQLAFDQQPFPGDWNEACLHIAARIRAGGSVGDVKKPPTNDEVLKATQGDVALYGTGGYTEIKNEDGTVTFKKMTVEEACELWNRP